MSETCLMSLNRYRMRHMAKQGHRGAYLAGLLLAKTDKLLSVILLCNTLCNAAVSTLIASIVVHLFGSSHIILLASTVFATFILLVFAEISPKVIAASYPETTGFFASYILYPLLIALNPIILLINGLVRYFLRSLGIRLNFEKNLHAITTEELHSIVSEASHVIPHKNRTILLNLLELEKVTVDDIMTTYTQIEYLRLSDSMSDIMARINTVSHAYLPVLEGINDDIVGIIEVARVRNYIHDHALEEMTREQLMSLIEESYAIPQNTPLYTQMYAFQEQKKRIVLVVDEYGGLKGIVTLEDILEEIVGDFIDRSPSQISSYKQEADGGWIVDGGSSLRHLNKKLSLNLPLGKAKTLNGLLLDYLQDIPESHVSLKINEHTLQILQTQDHIIRRIKIYP